MLLPAEGENKPLAHYLNHILAWVLYTGFIYGVNYLANHNLQLYQTIFFLLPLCLTFYVSVYCLKLYKEKGVLWSIASFFIVFLVMSGFGYMYLYWLLPQFGIRLFTSSHFEDFLKRAFLGYVQYFPN